MTQPRYEFWRPITPVLRFEIPDQAEFYDPMHEKWCPRRDSLFDESQLELQWRVPVEVIPLDVAVNVVLQNAVVNPNIGKGLWQVFIGGEVIESNRFESLHLLVIDHLRKAAQ